MTTLILRTSFILMLLGCSYTNHASSAASAPMRAWDQILDAEFFVAARLNRQISQEAGERIYVFSRTSGNTDDIAFSIVVAVGPAGTRLDPNPWQSARDATDDAARPRDFPDIGLRAQRQSDRFGPDGAMSGIVFTTPDALFDVLVSVFEKSTSDSEQSPTATESARRIAQAYDDTFQ